MKKLLLFILGFMFMALSACQPVQNNTMENSPDGILSIQFEKTIFSIDENINVTICIGMEDGYENYVNDHPNYHIQLKVTNDGRFYSDSDGRLYCDMGGQVLKDLTFDPLLYDYSFEKDKEPIFNYSEVFTLPSELFTNNEGAFYIFLHLESDGLQKFIPYEFSYSIIDEQINIVKVNNGRYS